MSAPDVSVRRPSAAWALALVLLAACQAPLVQPPTEAEARDFLERAVELAQAGDFDGLCAMGGGNCERILERAGRNVPSADPEIVGTRLHAPSANVPGSVVLEICGEDDSLEPYYSEMAVSWNDGALMGIEPIYWSGFGIADSQSVGDDVAADPDERCL